MLRRLFRSGNSLAVAIPQVMAEAVGLAVGDDVVVEHDVEAGAILVWPRAAWEQTGLSSDYVRLVGAFVRDYADALKALERE